MSQPGNPNYINNAEGQAANSGQANAPQTTPGNIPGQPDFTGMPNQHISPQQRAGEIAYYLQEAQTECRADIDRVEDQQAKQLFGQIASILDQPIQQLFAFQGSGNESPLQTH